jgi:hypothetical protein
MLLACLFNPSLANHKEDDPTCTLLCHIASHNSFGGLVIVNNVVPLIATTPAEAIEMTRWDKSQDW